MTSFPAERHIDQAAQDKLNFIHHAEALVELIQSTSPPQVIGVTGDWGSGKTSLMKLSQEIIHEQLSDSVLPLWFNAWMYDSSVSLLYPLAKLLHDALPQRAKGSSVNWSNIARGALLTLAHIGFNRIDSTLGLRTTFNDVKTLTEAIPEDIDLVDQWLDDITHLRNQLGELVKTLCAEHSVNRLCIFVDDLDRCSSTTAIKLLESMRIHFDVEGVIFVAGINVDALCEGLNTHAQSASARSFLEKLIHLEYRVPRNISALMQLAMDTLDEIKPGDERLEQLCQSAIGLCLQSPAATPRMVKRIVKQLIVCYIQMPNVSNLNMMPAHAVFISLKLTYPRMFSLLLDDHTSLTRAYHFLGNDKTNRRALIDAGHDMYLEPLRKEGIPRRYVQALMDFDFEGQRLQDRDFSSCISEVSQLL